MLLILMINMRVTTVDVAQHRCFPQSESNNRLYGIANTWSFTKPRDNTTGIASKRLKGIKAMACQRKRVRPRLLATLCACTVIVDVKMYNYLKAPAA